MPREQIEWIHYRSGEGDKYVLVVGDSILWATHPQMESILSETPYAMTSITTAHGVNEEQLVRSVTMLAFLNNTGYEAVYFNNGLHTRGQSPEEYAENYERAVLALMKAIPAKKWILGLSTPISNVQTAQWENTAPISNQEIESLKERNELVLKYNEKVRGIAKKLGLPYYDAYAIVEGRDDLKTDAYHYNPEGCEIIAKGVLGCVLDELKK